MQKNRSGQFVYFSLVSALSGNPVTGSSGNISGRKSLDGLSGLIVLSGNIIELGGGSYRANLYDFDTNGDQVGYFFSASGCVPVQYQFDMIDGNGSGRIFLGSGSITSGLIASGIVFPASGAFVNTPPSTLSGVFGTASLNSGQQTLVYSGQLSGQVVNLLSGNQVQVWSGTQVNIFSGQQYPASGFMPLRPFMVGWSLSGTGVGTDFVDFGAAFAVSGVDTLKDDIVVIRQGTGVNQARVIIAYNGSGLATISPPWGTKPLSGSVLEIWPGATITATSGTIIPVSGLTYPASGAFVTVPKATLSGVVANSGLFVTATASVDPASISGAFVTVPKETISGVVANSGLFVTATATVASGGVYLASGHFLFGSGQFYLASGHQAALYSGQTVGVYSGQLSGQVITAASGVFASVPIVSISGVTANSGLFVTVPIATISGAIANSGLFVTVPIATISGAIANSGLFVTATASVDPASISGAFVTVPTATISGVVANSGLFVTVPTSTISGVFGTATLNSGQQVLIYSGQLSGQQVNLLSGNQVQVWSGTQVNVFSGQVFPASGMVGRELLTYNYSGLTGFSGQRNLLNATRKLINKFDMTATSGYLSVYQENDTTIAYQQAVTAQSGASPVVSLDTRE